MFIQIKLVVRRLRAILMKTELYFLNLSGKHLPGGSDYKR